MALTKVIGAGAEGLTLSSTSLTVANGLTLTDGDIALASGHGISFAATDNGSGTLGNELFDDYEEGTFTADLDASSATITQSVSRGVYTKIGNQVSVNVYVQCDGTLSTNSNAVSILGLPFTSVNNSQTVYYSAAGMRYVTMSTNYEVLMGYINNNDTKIQLYQHGKGQTPLALPSSGLNNSSGWIILQMFYYTD